MNVDYNKKKVSDITTLPEGWAWQDADKDTALTVGTAVKATAVYTGADKGNYETESVEISITRAECTHATTEVKNAKDATCTEKGYTGDTCCTVCGKVITAGADIEALGHDMTETISEKVAATCTETGKEAVIGSSRCDHTEGGSVIDALGHDFADTWTYDETHHWYSATCGHETEVSDKAEHTFGEWVTVTEATEDSEGLKERSCSCGYKETAKIGANAFNGCKKLKIIKITSTKLTSKTVSKNAFKGLRKAITIKVPKEKLSEYKKLFKQKGLSSKVIVKGY